MLHVYMCLIAQAELRTSAVATVFGLKLQFLEDSHALSNTATPGMLQAAAKRLQAHMGGETL